MRNLKKGFTLIELLVVIAIIGILATTLAPKLREQLAKAKDAKAISLLGAVRTASKIVLTEEMTNSDGAIAIDFKKILDKLDEKTKKIVTIDKTDNKKATVPIGGSRLDESGKLTYGGVATMTVDSETGEVTIEGPTTESYSTENKKWSDY